jgi:polyhydroxybutyrate depolymerase
MTALAWKSSSPTLCKPLLEVRAAVVLMNPFHFAPLRKPGSLACLALLGLASFVWVTKLHAAPTAHTEITLPVGGLERHALLHLPTRSGNGDGVAQSLPLVIMLHGYGGSSTNAMRETRWSDKADAERFAVVYPDATRRQPNQAPSLRHNPQAWNDGSGRFHPPGQEVNDVEFIRSLIDELKKQQPIDPRRIYVTGFSNGASMALRVGAELADRVTAIAPVAGASWLENLQPVRGISLMYLTGTADPLNPLEGGAPKLGRLSRAQGKVDTPTPQSKPKNSLDVLMAQWTQALRCTAAPTADATVNGVRTRRHSGCRDDADVAFVTIEGLGHIWAGGVNQMPEILVGKPTDKLNATDVIWDFFRNKRLP